MYARHSYTNEVHTCKPTENRKSEYCCTSTRTSRSNKKRERYSKGSKSSTTKIENTAAAAAAVLHTAKDNEFRVHTKNCNTEKGRRCRLETRVSLRTSREGIEAYPHLLETIVFLCLQSRGSPWGMWVTSYLILDVQKPEQQARQQAAKSSFPSCTCSARCSACEEETFRAIDRDQHRERHQCLLSLRACSSACHSLVAFHAAWPWLARTQQK